MSKNENKDEDLDLYLCKLPSWVQWQFISPLLVCMCICTIIAIILLIPIVQGYFGKEKAGKPWS